jgi:PAS domain S-box-containing protein
MRKPLIKSLLIAALLSLSGIAGNTLAVPIAFGVMFIFGSIFSVIAVSRLGIWFGVGVALIASSYTFVLWHHPYAIIIFTVEILWMGFALQRGRSNLLLIDSLYWLLLGCPLVALFYGGIMELGFQNTVIIVLKQALNGMFNTLLAWISLSLLPRISWETPRLYHRPVPYKQIIFQVAAAFLMIPALGILLFLTRREVSATQTRMLHDIQLESQFTASSIGKWITDYTNATRIIAELGSKHPLHPSDELQEELKSIHQLFPLFHTVILADGMATNIVCDPPVNEKGESTIGINLSDRAWYKEMSSTLQPVISDVFTGKVTILAPIFVISTPIVINGQLSHYGVGAINLNKLQQLLEQTNHYQKISCTIMDRHDKVIVSTDKSRQPLEALQQKSGQIISVSDTTSLSIPGSKKNISIMDAWKGAYYFSRLPIPDTPWTLLVESSVAPMQSYFYNTTIWGLSIVTAFLVVMLALAALVSRYLTTPILALARISKNLPAKIAGQEKISWPHSNFIELDELIENFQHSAVTIDHNLATINAYNAELEKTVLARTADLEKERQRLDSIIEATNIGTWEWNVQSGETIFNERWASILGYRMTELQPINIQTWLEHTHPEDLLLSESLLEQHFAGILDYYEYECRMRHKDGHWVWVHDRGKVMSHTMDGKPLIMSGTHTDISIRKHAEEELEEKTRQLELLTKNLEHQVEEEVGLRLQGEQILIQQSKLAAMGEMLGAIAHQWRQPLNSLGLIIQNLQEAKAFEEMNQEVVDRTVQKSMNLIQHMSKTIDDFRNFFKPDKQKSTFDATRVVGDALQLVSNQLSSNRIDYNLTCHTHNKSFNTMTTLPACEAILITGYRNEFRHVIMNILNNAQDAILTHRSCTNNQAQLLSRIDINIYHADTTVTIKIADNGGGIDAELLDKIFLPYFTTKEPDKGTGTGLYMSKLIIEHMSGRLSARNTRQGVVFTIELPGQKETSKRPEVSFNDEVST